MDAAVVGREYLKQFRELVAERVPFLQLTGKSRGTYLILINEETVRPMKYGTVEFSKAEGSRSISIYLYTPCAQVYIGTIAEDHKLEELSNKIKTHFFKVMAGLGPKVLNTLCDLSSSFTKLNEVLPPGLQFEGDIKKFCDLLYLHFQNSPMSLEYEKAKGRFKDVRES
ncbi:hypothetical protein BNJ_00150 [Kaumoebavirus]|uniref:hypothetical protein n=1 Tax=Kaumoebavirus TaxID=1859492 RepID=UPI0009C215BD|nr:hypothetical protein BNJ_00150 [Kaumoebavirus]ARA71982.1 hypothetical protein BNJ_00150 [Kaumoebavirus]